MQEITVQFGAGGEPWLKSRVIDRESLAGLKQGIIVQTGFLFGVDVPADALTEKVTALEAERFLASTWRSKTETEIFAEFDAVMAKVPVRPEEEIPLWDKLE